MNPSLLIPTLCSVLLLTAFAFVFASQMAPLFLLVTSTVLLILSYMMHRSQFQSDYRNSTWQEGLRPLAPYVLVGFVILLGAGYFFIMTPDGAAPAAGAPAAAPAKATGGKRFSRR